MSDSITKTMYQLKVKFVTPVLGSQPGAKTPASDYVRDKVKEARPDLNLEDEVGTVPEELEKGTTLFQRGENGKPMFLNYQIKGMIKEAGSVMNGLNGVANLKSKLDNLLFVYPRRIPVATDKEITILERPLRGQTQQGPRTTLARSEMIAEGATFECELEVLESPKAKINEELLRALLDYSTRKGMGQWRNSGSYGQIEYQLTKKE